MNCNNYNRQNSSVNNQINNNRQNAASSNQNTYLRSPLYRYNSSGNPQIYNNTGNSNCVNNPNSINNTLRNNMTESPDTLCPCQNAGCAPGDMPVDDMTIGMSYVPWQNWDNIYDSAEALSRGTIFADLYKPWLGRSIGNE